MSSYVEPTPLHEGVFDFLTSDHDDNVTQFDDSPFYGNFTHCGAGPNNLGRYISMILFTVVCIIGLFGNTLVIYVVLR